ncbi:MAG: hypothetical protein AB1861_08985 [Cyanobacteriota bacterium]
MNQFIYLKGNCPVCAGARKDCRQSSRTNLIHCRDSEATSLDYVLVGEDSLGFGMYGDKREIEAASEQQRQEWRRQRKLKKQQRLQEKKRQRSHCFEVCKKFTSFSLNSHLSAALVGGKR